MPFWIAPLSNDKLFRGEGGNPSWGAVPLLPREISVLLRESHEHNGAQEIVSPQTFGRHGAEWQEGRGKPVGVNTSMWSPCSFCRLIWVFTAHARLGGSINASPGASRMTRHRSSLANAALSQGVLNRCVCVCVLSPALAARINPFGVPGPAQEVLLCSSVLPVESTCSSCSAFPFFGFVFCVLHSASWKAVLSAAPFSSVRSAVWTEHL